MHHWAGSCSPLALPLVGLIFLLEGMGTPIPVEIPLGIVALRIARCGNSYWQMVWLMWATTMVGNGIGYALGYYGGRTLALRFVSWLRIKPETWARMEGWFHQHGIKVVIATRWINWGFAQNMWLAGITRVPAGRFFAITTVNNFLWAMGWTWLTLKAATFLSRRRIFDFIHDSKIRIGLTVLGIILIGLGVSYLYRWYRRQQTPTPEQPGSGEMPG